MTREKVRLREIAYARSGDKGRHANIGVIAYTAEGYRFLVEQLTDQVVHAFFEPMGVEEVVRYPLPNLGALNFLLKGILGEGGSRSLRIDAQGKALGQALLELELMVSEDVLCRCRP